MRDVVSFLLEVSEILGIEGGGCRRGEGFRKVSVAINKCWGLYAWDSIRARQSCKEGGRKEGRKENKSVSRKSA